MILLKKVTNTFIFTFKIDIYTIKVLAFQLYAAAANLILLQNLIFLIVDNTLAII